MTKYTKSKKFYKPNHNNGLFFLSILVVLAIFSLSFIYLIQANSLVSCSYQIRQQKEQFEKFQVENQNLKMQIAQWHSPVNLEELVQSLNMIENGQVVYLGKEKGVAVK